MKLCDNHQILFGVLIAALGVSVALNVYCFASRCCSGKKISKDRSRRHSSAFLKTSSENGSPRQMEDNPIYGNIALQSTQPATDSSFTSSVRRDQRRINDISQDCYANLNLQMAVLDGGPSAPLSPGGPDFDKDLADAEVRSDVSDLYASVQTRAKILHLDSEEEYANHL